MKIALLRNLYISLLIVILAACRSEIMNPDELVVAPESKKGGGSEIVTLNADAFIRRAFIKKKASAGYRMTASVSNSEPDTVHIIDVKIKASKGAPSPTIKKFTLYWEKSEPKAEVSSFSSDELDFVEDAVGKTYEVSYTMLNAQGKKIGKVKKKNITVEPPEANLPVLESIRITNSSGKQWICEIVISDPSNIIDNAEVEFLDEYSGPAPNPTIVSLSFAGEINLGQELYTGILSFEGDPTKTNYPLLVSGNAKDIKIFTIETSSTPAYSDL
ncbi:hypothetical protein [Ekhidna sp.]|uniref:hypothetical protein n=1 Tax=Ekhidna sp. TaxID=2608089 RepID=UPI003B509DD7